MAGSRWEEYPQMTKRTECFGNPLKIRQKPNHKRKLNTERNWQNYLTHFIGQRNWQSYLTYFIGQHMKVVIPLPRVHTPLPCYVFLKHLMEFLSQPCHGASTGIISRETFSPLSGHQQNCSEAACISRVLGY